MKVARRTGGVALSLEGLPLPAWQFDHGGHATQFNAAFLAWCGRTPSEMLGLGWQTLVHADDLLALRHACASASSASSACAHDARLRRADGAWRWLRLSLGAGPQGLVACAQDVSDLHQAAHDARADAGLLREILDQLPAFVLIKDADNYILDANRRANLYFTGRDVSMRGHSTYEMFPPAEAEAWHAQDRAVLDRGTPLFGVVEQMRTSGPPRWHRMDKLPFTPRGATAPLCLVMGVEITAEKTLELRLRELIEDGEALLRVLRQREYEQNLILDNIPVMILYKDTDNRVLRANRHAAELLGVPLAELEGRHLGLALPRDAGELYLHDLEVLRSRQPLTQVEAQITTRRNEQRSLRLHLLPCCDATGALTRLMVVGEDITLTHHYEQELERRASQAEALLMELERRGNELQIIFDHLPARIVYKDTRNNLLRANRFAAEFVGLPLETMAGRSLSEIYGADAAARYHRDDLEVIRTRRPLSNLIEHFDIERERRWMRTEKVPLFDTSGDITGIVVLSLDITAQVRAEQELERQRAELELLLDSSPALILSHDGDGRVLRVNRTGAAHFGYSEEQMQGRNLRELLGASATDWLNDGYLAMQSGRAQRRTNAPLRGAGCSGETRYWHIETAPVKDARGQVSGVLLIAQDTTERKRIEDELRRQKEEMQIILDHIPTSILYKDAENTLLRVNRAAAELVGMRAEDMQGQPANRFFPDPEGRLWQEDLNVMRSRRPRLRQMLRMTLADGHEHWLRYHKIPYLDAAGRTVGVLVVSEDHSADLAAQEALQGRLLQAGRHAAESVGMLDTLPFGVMLIGADGALVRVNRVAAAFLGAAPEALVGREPYALFGDGSAAWRERDRRVLRSGGADLDFIGELRRADGTRCKLRMHRMRYVAAEGAAVGVLVVFRAAGDAACAGLGPQANVPAI